MLRISRTRVNGTRGSLIHMIIIRIEVERMVQIDSKLFLSQQLKGGIQKL